MKEYKIKTVRAEGSEYDDYTTYRNPNEALRKEIAEFKIDETKFEAGWPEKEWTIVEYEEKEVKCQNGRDIKFFTKEEVVKALSDKLHEERNKKYLAYKYFRDSFGIVSHHHKYQGGQKLTRIDLQEGSSILGGVNTTRVCFYGPEYEYEFRDWETEIHVKYRSSYTSMNLFFNSEGDFVNRDYNINLNYFECKDIDPKKILDAFARKIKSLGDLHHCNGKYYSKTHCYVPFYYGDRENELGVEIYESTDGKTYKKSRCAAIKKPKKLEKKSGADLLETIFALAPEGYLNSFRLEKEVENV